MKEAKHTSHSETKAITWRAPEFLYRKKTLLWHTNVAIFFFITLVLLWFAGNWPGAIIVIALFFVFIYNSDRKPDLVTYKVDHTGISIGDQHFLYSEIHSFSVDTSHSTPVIIFELNHSLSLPVTMLIKPSDVDEIFETLLDYVPLNPNLSFTRWLTHWLHY